MVNMEEESSKDSALVKILRDGRRKMGLYPIDRSHIDSKTTTENLNTKEFRHKRMEAVKDFLINELKWEDTSVLVQTKWNERTSIMWIETKNEDITNKIFYQAADIKNPDIRTMNYFPGEIFDRMKELDELCKKEKEKDTTFRYQIRLGHEDLILRTRSNGSTKWEDQPINKYGDLTPIRVVYYRGNMDWEEKSPPKGRKNKRVRSEDKTPERVVKKIMIENIHEGSLRPQTKKNFSSATPSTTSPTVASNLKSTL